MEMTSNTHIIYGKQQWSQYMSDENFIRHNTI